MSVRLHVNVDHVATVRNARGTRYPDPLFAAQLCEAAGADGITAHLREDRRHITDDDVRALRARIGTHLNLEMAATDEMIAIAESVAPDTITLVPERRQERTTEGGLDVVRQRDAIARTVTIARKIHARVSLFIAPDVATVEHCAAAGVDQIELHTGEYCHAIGAEAGPQLERLRAAAERGLELGLEVAAGHGLTRHNVVDAMAIGGITEVNIGHALIADAVFFGLERAVSDMRAAIERGVARRSERR